MGIHGFNKWLEEMGYVPERDVYVSNKHKLLVDAKNLMYRLAYSVPFDTPNFTQAIADALINMFVPFAHVTFVNDGKISEDHPKFETCCKRKRDRVQQQETAKKRKLEDVEDVSGSVDRQLRAARGVSFEDSLKVMQLLEAVPHFVMVQIQEGEADPYLMQHAKDFDFVVTQDSDLLMAGVNNMLFEFCTPKQAVFRTRDILQKVGLTLNQLQEIACLAGNDYVKASIRGMGLKRAYEMIKKYGNCEAMLTNWTLKERKKFVVPDNLLVELKKATKLYQLEVVEKEEEEKNNEELSNWTLKQHKKSAVPDNLFVQLQKATNLHLLEAVEKEKTEFVVE